MVNIPKKLVVLLLPAALLWVFVGCVLICEDDCQEITDVKSFGLAIVVQNQTSCAHCQITSLPAAMTTKRSFWHAYEVPSPLPYLNLFTVSPNGASSLLLASRPPLLLHLRHDPPLSLRI